MGYGSEALEQFADFTTVGTIGFPRKKYKFDIILQCPEFILHHL
jgi:hypothetical protein